MTLSTRQAEIIEAARRQVAQEIFDAHVAREVERLKQHRGLWQRLLDKLPFTIQVRRKP